MGARARESHTWPGNVRTRPRTHAAGPRESLIHAWPAAGVARLRNARVLRMMDKETECRARMGETERKRERT